MSFAAGDGTKEGKEDKAVGIPVESTVGTEVGMEVNGAEKRSEDSSGDGGVV